ncbi:MAG: hypothetical protein JO197_19675 [Acidobacteria bacterium]|nr:hypothetical protein [Acidobacteriota bacterium]MBV9478579.1 hypothetical protein [Acidobacteriota bacterium]
MAALTPEPRPKIPIGLVLRRGLRRRCPRCGEGPLFRRWIEVHERCSACGLLYQTDHGDTWGFVLIMDRVPLFIGIVLVYFGFRSTSMTLGIGFLVGLLVPLIATTPNREGLAIAMVYLWRIYLPDPSDPIHQREYVIEKRGN